MRLHLIRIIRPALRSERFIHRVNDFHQGLTDLRCERYVLSQGPRVAGLNLAIKPNQQTSSIMAQNGGHGDLIRSSVAGSERRRPLRVRQSAGAARLKQPPPSSPGCLTSPPPPQAPACSASAGSASAQPATGNRLLPIASHPRPPRPVYIFDYPCRQDDKGFHFKISCFAGKALLNDSLLDLSNLIESLLC